MKFKIILISLCLLIFQPSIYAEEIYRWVDEKGKVHYGNKPKNKDAKIFDKKNIQSVKMVKTKFKPIRSNNSDKYRKNLRAQDRDNLNKNCSKLKDKKRTLETKMNRTAHGVKAFENYKDKIKNLEEQIQKSC